MLCADVPKLAHEMQIALLGLHWPLLTAQVWDHARVQVALSNILAGIGLR